MKRSRILIPGLYLFSIVLLSLQATSAMFSDTHKANNSTMAASSLAFSIRGPGGEKLSSTRIERDVRPGATTIKEFIIRNEGSEDFRYTIGTKNVNTDNELCGKISLNIKRGDTHIYTGPLGLFVSEPVTYSNGINKWTISTGLSADSEALMNSLCEFTIHVSAWQKNLPSSQGFSDNKEFNNALRSTTWVTTYFTKEQNNRSVSFSVNHIQEYTRIEYEITYQSDQGTRGIRGSHDLSQTDQFIRNDLTLGSCTSGGVCTIDTSVRDFRLRVTLTKSNGTTDVVHKIL